MIHGAILLLLKYKQPYILLLLKYKLPYILHDPRATLLLLKYKQPNILHDQPSYLTPINIQTTLYLT